MEASPDDPPPASTLKTGRPHNPHLSLVRNILTRLVREATPIWEPFSWHVCAKCVPYSKAGNHFQEDFCKGMFRPSLPERPYCREVMLREDLRPSLPERPCCREVMLREDHRPNLPERPCCREVMLREGVEGADLRPRGVLVVVHALQPIPLVS